MSHMSFKRIIKRIKEEVYSTIEIAKITKLSSALQTFLGKICIQIMVHNGHVEYKWIRKILIKKHNAMNEYFKKIFPVMHKDDKFIVPAQKEELRDCIWICWWQGIENAPFIVKQCIESIKLHAGNHRVIIITDNNVNEYVKFPSWIVSKFRKGIISKTHLSDILRLMLLATYGGVWLDSTFLCTGSLEDCFSEPVWSIKRPGYRHSSVACGRFANYSFGCNTDYRYIFATLLDYLLMYWKKYDYMVDYLFLDYLIVLAMDREKDVFEAFDNIRPNNLQCDELLSCLNKPFDKHLWKSMTNDTVLFKLTWKTTFHTVVDGKKTFWGKLQDDLLYNIQ